MSDQSNQIIREHHFFVSAAKGVFLHPERGIVRVEDPIKIADARQFGLSPIILYGLAVPKIQIQWLTFSSMQQPRPLLEVLVSAWRSSDALRGPPDFLRINRFVNEAAPSLRDDVAEFGVQLVVVDGKEKSVSASLRTAQAQCSRVGTLYEILHRDGDPVADDIDGLSKQAHEESVWRNSEEAGPKGPWLSLPKRRVSHVPTVSLDWTPGAWLTSWESSLPPSTPRYFHESKDGRRHWLYSGRPDVPDHLEEGDDPDSDVDDFEEDEMEFDATHFDDQSGLGEVVKVAVACWPNSLKEIAEAVDATQKDLRWLMSGRADPGSSVRYSLQAILGIEMDESGYYRVAGPCAVIAKARSIENLYDQLSHGGDAHPFECLPEAGAADPSWRYFFINSYGGGPSIIMAPRGSDITDRLPKYLLNFEGIRTVPAEFYRDVVATCARACLSPEANVPEMKDFVSRHYVAGTSTIWEPERLHPPIY